MTAAAISEERSAAHGVRWNLSHLYEEPARAAIDRDLAASLAAANAFAARYRGRVAQLGARELAESVDAYEAALKPASRAGAYASLQFAADTQTPAHGALVAHVQEKGTEVRNALRFFELEWIAVDAARAESLLADPALAKRRHYLAAARRYRPHVLSEAEERILDETANQGSRAWSRLFDETVASLRFTPVLAGKPEERGLEETLALLYDARRERRQAGAAALTEGLRNSSRVIAFALNTLVASKATEDRLRKYAGMMDERHLANEIEATSVDALMSACERAFPLVQRYYRLKAKLLGIPQLADYDRYAPLFEEKRARSWAEARDIVLRSYRAFSPEIANIASRFFAGDWIDAEVRPGKSGGAFCATTLPELHPYVLMSFTGESRDVMTLAHELGHGVHSVLAEPCGLLEQQAPLTTAETASVFGEMLVFRALMKEESDPKARLALLCGKLEDAFATVFRQVVLTRFEEKLHAARRSEGELPAARINALWLEANAPMHGDAVALSDDYAWWWLYIGHFVHSPFYCYAYAFGELLVLALLGRYDAEGAPFIAKYRALLAAGGSETPSVLLARVGLDVTDAKFWDGGIAVIEGMVAQAEALSAQIG
ncbi:MAG: M3 family oligoendopeptidase [Deltaproteobacteria bacterium]|nr:M3 family oligoendopeptidase [Deltaproteobacteria bacterium]